MLGVLLAVVFIMVVAMGALGGYLLVSMKRRIDEDRELDDANIKKQADALAVAKGDLSKELGTVSATTKKAQEETKKVQEEIGTKVAASDGQVAKIVEQATGFEGAIGDHTKEIETGRARLNDHIVTFNSEVLRIDGTSTDLGNRLGELEVLAPVVKRLTIEEDGINVCGFNSASSSMCRKIKFAAV
jgi:hypothetical protein